MTASNEPDLKTKTKHTTGAGVVGQQGLLLFSPRMKQDTDLTGSTADFENEPM